MVQKNMPIILIGNKPSTLSGTLTIKKIKPVEFLYI